MIGIIDYKAGNLTSVARALQYIKQPFEITNKTDRLVEMTHVIFPGVGAAGEAMENLRRTGLGKFLKHWIQAGKPLMGICLGTQVIFEYSEENDTPCLGIVPGSVRRFPDGLKRGKQPLKIPHMGWNEVVFMIGHPVFDGIPKGAEFYFVHGYYPAPADETWVAGRTEYGISFCSAIAHGSLVATQFHPEKSGRAGLKILENFCSWRGSHAQ
ncbi:MAG: imidazole glycerol phosphate synthase subunit HisH [Syntrophales bacterium]|jgi:glutamine amidotransferase